MAFGVGSVKSWKYQDRVFEQSFKHRHVHSNWLALEQRSFGDECNLPRTHQTRGKSVLVERSLKEGRGALFTGRNVGGDCLRTFRAHNVHRLRHEFIGHTLERTSKSLACR